MSIILLASVGAYLNANKTFQFILLLFMKGNPKHCLHYTALEFTLCVVMAKQEGKKTSSIKEKCYTELKCNILGFILIYLDQKMLITISDSQQFCC